MEKEKQGTCYALLAAVGGYRQMNLPDLPSWEEERKRMRAALVNGLQLEPERIAEIGTGKMVSGRELASTLLGFSRTLNPEDTVLLWFSGHGRNGALVFSDMEIGLSGILDYMQKLPAKGKVLLIDCCCAGKFTVAKTDPMRLKETISDYAGRGIAVMASSAADEASWIGKGGSCSLYTELVCQVMESGVQVRNGMIFLNDINEEVRYQMEAWNRAHPAESQHPVFRSCMGGSVTFSVKRGKQYQTKTVVRELESCRICEVRPLSTADKKRLAVIVIPKQMPVLASVNSEKDSAKEKEGRRTLARLTRQIVKEVGTAAVFHSERGERRFGNQQAQAVWCYFAQDESDLTQNRYFARTAWAQTESLRRLYYREGDQAAVTDGIWVWYNQAYQMLRDLMKPAEEKRAWEQEARGLLCTVVSQAETFLDAFREVENGTRTAASLSEDYGSWMRKVIESYYRLGDMEVPPDCLHDWSETLCELAGYVVDLAQQLEQVKNKTWQERERWLMKLTIRRYYECLEKMKGLEPAILPDTGSEVE